MKNLQKLLLVALSLLLLTIGFSLYGYYFIGEQNKINHYQEEVENKVIGQLQTLQAVSRGINLLSLHADINPALRRQTVQRLDSLLGQLQNEAAAIRRGFQQHQGLGAAGKNYQPATVLLQEYHSLSREVVSGSNTADIAMIHKKEAALTSSLRELDKQLHQLESDTESRLSTMQQAVFGALLAALVFLITIVILPVFRQGFRQHRELQQTMQDCRKSESLLQTIIDSSPDIIFVQDLQNRFVMVNQTMASSVGKDPAFFTGKNDLEAGMDKKWVLGNPTEGIRGFWHDNAEVTGKGRTLRIPEERLVIGGEEKVATTTKVPLLAPDGSVWGLLGFSHDLTARVKMEEKLRASEENYRYLFQSNPAPMWIYAEDDHRFLKVNQRAVEHYGFSREEFLSMTILDIRPPREHQRLEAVLSEVKGEDCNNLRGVWIHRKKNGKHIYVQIVSHKIVYKDRAAMLILAQDVTENIRMHRRLLKLQQARQNEIARATIDAGERQRDAIGKELHDNVNQILSAAKLHLEMLRGDVPNPEEFRDKGIKLVGKAIDEIRRLSKSLVPPSIHDVGLVHSLEELVEAIEMVNPLRISLQIDGLVEERLPEGLKLTLYRIVQEQTTNILKYAAATDAVIALRRLESGELQLVISDNGKGFDPSRHPKGIGLNNIRNRAEIYQGAMTIRSAVGQGCELTVLFGGEATGWQAAVNLNSMIAA